MACPDGDDWWIRTVEYYLSSAKNEMLTVRPSVRLLGRRHVILFMMACVRSAKRHLLGTDAIDAIYYALSLLVAVGDGATLVHAANESLLPH